MIIRTVSVIFVCSVAPAGIVTSLPRVASTAPVPAPPPMPAPIAAPFLPPAIAPIAVPTPAPMPIFFASSPFVASAWRDDARGGDAIRRVHDGHFVEAKRDRRASFHLARSLGRHDGARHWRAFGNDCPYPRRRPASQLSRERADRVSPFPMTPPSRASAPGRCPTAHPSASS